MAQQWHYTKGNKQIGPVSAAELKQLALSGHLQPNDLVWKQGMSSWASAKKVKGLFAELPVAPVLQSASHPLSQFNASAPKDSQARNAGKSSVFSDADVQSISLCANRLVDILKESIRIANESRNPDTRASRFRVAKQKLEELMELRAKYPFIEVSKFTEFEKCITRMEIEIGETEQELSIEKTVHKSTTEKAASDAAESPNSIIVLTPRVSRSTARARKISFENLLYMRLPKAPMAWEDGYLAKSEAIQDANSIVVKETCVKGSRNSIPRFNVGNNGWEVVKEERLPPSERPDPAFKQMFPTAYSTLWLDTKGRRAGFESLFAVALTTDRAGTRRAERGLNHDVYRADVNANGSGMIFLSRGGTLHGYTETLEIMMEERIEELPEYVAQAKRFGIERSALKNHTRCVSLSTDRSRYLITVVDEAWCYEMSSGNVIWGLRFPAKDGWTEIAAERSERVGASAEINAALRLMELTFPVTPEAITQRYRVLAMRWHPDRNPGNSGSTRQFQELGAAMEILTGTDLSRLSSTETERVSYKQVLQNGLISTPERRTAAFSVEMRVGGAFGADWIYATDFARTAHSTFLAGYSGRIVEVDASGLPLRVYDIGAVPRQIAETHKYRYILTVTRLYVLCQDQLVAIVDVFQKGKLIVADTGFGLLQPKQFHWFNPIGHRIGTVKTRDPIRRVYSGPAGLIVETRSHRGIIQGAPSWW